VGPLALAVIATYHLGDARTELTVAAWQHRFNEQFVRVMPATVAQLQESIRDLVAKEYGWHNARRRGLDREPQFVEDRRNFLYYQALDLFEQEKLRPRIEITREEAEACYRREILEFTKPLRARGRLLRFRDLADAQGWMRTRDGSAVLVAEAIEVSRQSPIPGGEKLIERILDFPDGRPFGPIRTPSGLVVFFKETTERGRRPYAEVADLIRSKLAQRKLEALELTLAREWAPRYVIEDRLHPQEFGVTDPVEKPWVARN
jgi:hypothetical protein